MPENRLEAEIVQIDMTESDELLIVRITGDVDLSCSGQVRDALLPSVGRFVTTVVDMSGVGSIDSSGIACLVEGHQLARKRSCRMVLAACGPSVSKVLQLAKLDDVFNIVSTLDEAIEAAND